MDEKRTKRGRKRDRDGLHKRGKAGTYHTKVKIDGRWRELSLGTTDHNEAKRIRSEKVAEFVQHLKLPDLAKLSLADASVLWLEKREKDGKAAGTLRIDRERLKPLKARLGAMRLCDLTPTEFSGYKLVRAGEVSPRTVNLELKVLRGILRAAKLWSRFSDDDDCGPMKENRTGPGRALTAEEEQRLYVVATRDPDASPAYLAAIAAANTTLRGIELKTLRLQDVDLDAQSIFVRRSKTDAGHRWLHLNENALWAFTKLMERAKLLGATEPSHYLFPRFEFKKRKGLKGSMQYDPQRHQVDWRKGWAKLKRAAGLVGLRFHDLRHHSITRMAENGVPDQTLIAIAGHVNRALLEHYSHVRREAKRVALEGISVQIDLTPKPPVSEPTKPVLVN